MKKRLLCVVLAVFTLISTVPGGVFAAPISEDGNTFVLFAAYSGGVVIHPEAVTYDETDSIKTALGNSGHEFDGLDDGIITGIDGIYPDYGFTRSANDGVFTLDRPAYEIAAFFFLDSSVEALTAETAAAISELIAVMADFNAADNGVKNYEDTKTAYSSALSALCVPLTDTAAINSLTEQLRESMRYYAESVLGAETVTLQLTFGVLPGSAAPLTQYTFTAADTYGNTNTLTQDDDLALVPGIYAFTLCDSGYNRAEGSMIVDDSGVVSIADTAVETISLFTGEWLDTVPQIRSESGDNGISYDNSGYSANHVTTYYVPDYLSDAYLYIEPGSGIDGTVYTTGNVSINAVYRNTAGVETDTARVWRSKMSVLGGLLDKGTAGNTAVFEARHVYDGYMVIQSYTANIERTPTLSGLLVTSNGAALNLGFRPDTAEYTQNVTSSDITVTPTVFGSYADGYSVAINGTVVPEGGAVTVPLNGAETIINVSVTLGGYSVDY